MLFLDSVKIKWLKFSNPERTRMSKGKAPTTGVTVVKMKQTNKPCKAFSECVQGQGYLGYQPETLSGPHFPTMPCFQKEESPLPLEPDLLMSKGGEQR